MSFIIRMCATLRAFCFGYTHMCCVVCGLLLCHRVHVALPDSVFPLPVCVVLRVCVMMLCCVFDNPNVLRYVRFAFEKSCCRVSADVVFSVLRVWLHARVRCFACVEFLIDPNVPRCVRFAFGHTTHTCVVFCDYTHIHACVMLHMCVLFLCICLCVVLRG